MEKIVHAKNNVSGNKMAVNCGDKSTKLSKPDIFTIDMTKSSALQKLRSEEAELMIDRYILKLRQQKEEMELQMLVDKRDLAIGNIRLENEEFIVYFYRL